MPRPPGRFPHDPESSFSVLRRFRVPSRLAAFVLPVGLAACGSGVPDDPGTVEGEALETPYAETFSVVERDGYRIVDIEASVVTWGGAAGGPPQRARLVLVPKGLEPPTLTGDLAAATLIRTPVQRIAVNDQPHEAMLRALGVEDRIVAVGGHNSYDDDLRRRGPVGPDPADRLWLAHAADARCAGGGGAGGAGRAHGRPHAHPAHGARRVARHSFRADLHRCRAALHGPCRLGASDGPADRERGGSRCIRADGRGGGRPPEVPRRGTAAAVGPLGLVQERGQSLGRHAAQRHWSPHSRRQRGARARRRRRSGARHLFRAIHRTAPAGRDGRRLLDDPRSAVRGVRRSGRAVALQGLSGRIASSGSRASAIPTRIRGSCGRWGPSVRTGSWPTS